MTDTLTYATITPDERARLHLAIHEAAHAVAGILLGATDVRAAIGDSRSGGATRCYGLLPDHEPLVAFAGPWAEARWQAGQRPKLREVWRHLDGCGRRDRDQIVSTFGTSVPPTSDRIERLLDMTWPAVVSVAQVLHRTSEARYDDICAALDIPETDNAHHLAAIGSGTWPVRITRPRLFTD
ncbi:UNVERIFIED_ORG: hypothetical protein L601_001500000130 [Gordonia westfalica J30]